MLITSLENERVKKYNKLKERKYREKQQEFLVEGMHLVLEAYKKGQIIELILEKDEVLPLDLPTVYVTNEIIHRITSLETPTNIMALCKFPEEKPFGNRILILDGIQDPGNLGTIIRSAAAFHIDTIVLGENTVDLYNPKTIRSTQGMLFHVNVIKRELSSFLDELKEQDIPIYGTRVEYGEDVRSLHTNDKNKFALIMGNEGAGVSPEILEKCDKYLYIKMDDAVESLNVSIATSIILYELDRRD